MVSDLGREFDRGCSLQFGIHMTACTAAVCSLTAASAFLLQAVLLETTGRTNNTVFDVATRNCRWKRTGLRPRHDKLGLTWKFVQDYFSKSVGAVKKVMLTYGPTGRSRGTATIIFTKPGSAAQAAHELNGVKVDNRAMKVCTPTCPNL
jgi:hypothetical protein